MNYETFQSHNLCSLRGIIQLPIYPSEEILSVAKHYFYFIIIIISGEISFVIVVVVVAAAAVAAVAPTEMPHFGLGFPFPPRAEGRTRR